MSVPTVCRVCLVNNLNLLGVQNDLQTTYERIIREKYNKVGYPLSMCYICLSVLQKCHRFMETARDTNRMLKQWHNQKNEVTFIKPLSIYSVSKAELVSIEHEDALDHDIKTEVDPEPECFTHEDVEKSDRDEQTDNSDSSNNSIYIDTVEDDNDLQTDPLSNYDVDIETRNSLASDSDDHTDVETIIKIRSPHESSVAHLKKLKTNKNKLQYQAQKTSEETTANNETSNEMTSLHTPLSQPENIKEGKAKIKSTLGKNNKTETAKLNKISKKLVIQNKTKKVSNVKNLNKLSFKTITTEKTEINKIITAPSNTAVTELNYNSNKHIDLYKYCEECNFKCTTKDVLAKHMRFHNKSRPHVCDVCHYRFLRLRNLNRHKALIHKIGTIKKYFCDICNYKSCNKSHLTCHIRSHIGNKPFACNICGFISAQKSDLKRHLSTHIQPYNCDLCSYKCRQKRNLIAHIRTHTGEKPFSCHICNFKCTQNRNLKAHIRTHTGEKPFSCNICSYKCIQKNYLKSHIRIHTGEKPFSCDICGYKCTQKHYLKLHLRTHTGEKPFTCRICRYKCARKDGLKSHMRTHT